MSLIYQLLDYERALKGGESPTASSKAASEDEEWERRRMELDSPNQESDEILKEAQAMDREMEERRARRLSAASNTSSTSSFTGSVGNGAPWRMRYGPGVYGRSRAASMESSVTSRSSISVLSEDPLEEEDEDEADPTKVTTPDTDATDEDTHQFGLTEKQSALYLRDVQTRRATQPPSAPPTKTSFYHQPPPPTASAFQTSFMTSQTRHTTKRPHSMFVGTSPSVTASTSNAGERPTKREKRRPPPLANLNPSVPFPSIHIVPDQDAGQSSQTSSTSIGVVSTPTTSSSSSSRNRRLSARILSLVPFPLKAAASSESLSSKTPSAALPTPTATQTLFVFPPSPRTRGASTPSTLTLISTPLLTPSFGSIQTPRAGLFRSRTDSRKSWIGLSAVTPTTATARVDARGMFEA
ncbi:hypothetical protein FRB91_009689 [Serendipita sp. 411]|nr:hypothetical protein FRB91_009689 [Serendipita sp. 411]